MADSFRVGAPLSQRRPPHKPPRAAERPLWLSMSLPLAFTTPLGKWGNIVMIALVALLNVAQPLPWLDRSWINHMAHREMLVAASATHFDRPPRLPIQLLPHFAAPARATARHALLGGPSGM